MISKNTRRASVIVVSLVLAAAGLALSRATSSPAIIINGKAAPQGLVGMVEGQTFRISVAYVKGFDPQPNPPGCELKVGFADSEGNTVGDPHIFELRPGVSRSFDHVAIGDPSIRQYVRPVVVDANPRAECPAVVTGELLDREGINGIIVYDNQPVVPSAFGAE
jgi:hypothetical protein